MPGAQDFTKLQKIKIVEMTLRTLLGRIESEAAMSEMTDFEKEIRDLVNSYGLDAAANTPDWVLAIYVESCLNAFIEAQKSREKHGDSDDREDV